MMSEENTVSIVKVYDVEIMNLLASTFIYTMSGMDVSTLMKQKELADSYRKEPTKSGYEKLIQETSRLKNPVHPELLRETAHCLFAMLINVFQASTSVAERDDEAKQNAFRSWVVLLVNEVYSMSQGKMEAGEVPSGNN